MLIAATLSAVVIIAAAAGALVVYHRRTTKISGKSFRSLYRRRFLGGIGSDTPTDETDESEPDTDGLDPSNIGGTGRRDENNSQSASNTNVTFQDCIDKRTLDRLESMAPDAIRQIRERHSIDQNAKVDTVEKLDQDLRQVIEDKLDEGQFDPTVTSALGVTYNVVNLPRQFRELTVPPRGETVHVAELEAVVGGALDDHDLHDAARTVVAVHDHCREIESYVRRREESYLNKRREVERTLTDIREMIDRFDGTLADRVWEFVIEGRHDQLPGVVDIERRLDTADQSLHACAFDDADYAVRNAGKAGDDLLMAVNFLGGVTGTIDHGSGRVTIPDDVMKALITDLVPILEQQYSVNLKLDGNKVVVTGGTLQSGDGGPPQSSNRGSQSGHNPSDDPSSARSAGSTDREESGGREQLSPDAVADEILFVLRDFDSCGGTHVVECQTEQLPDTVARREVLGALATFCRRQTDLVASVTLQENAPPGFFEIEFSEGTTPSTGLDALRERFTERHVK